MTQHDHHLFIGIDRSDQTIDYCSLDSSSRTLEQEKISSSPESLQQWLSALLDQLPSGKTIALCIEQPCDNLIHFFKRFDRVLIYPVNPALIKRYRESLSPSRAKDDRRDAHALARFVFERHDELAPFRQHDPLADQIAALVEKRRQLVDIRTSLTNRLTQCLKEAFPQAFDLIGETVFAPLACAFLQKWPTLQAVQKARPSSVAAFYRKHSCRRPKVIDERLAIIANAIALCDDPLALETHSLLVTSLVKQIQCVQGSIKAFDKWIAQKNAAHEDASFFASLPGAGEALAPRLLAFFGSDRSRYSSAAELQKHSGVAPLTKQSGKSHFVHRRYACNKFWRQTFVEWADQTYKKSLWAKAFYLQQKAKGHRHQSILRSLAYKWQRILFRCWKNHEPYCEKTYIAALEKSASPLLSMIKQVRISHPHLCEKKL